MKQVKYIFLWIALWAISAGSAQGQTIDSSMIHGLRELGSRSANPAIDMTNHSGIAYSNVQGLNDVADELKQVISDAGLSNFKVFDYTNYPFLTFMGAASDADVLMAKMETKIGALTSNSLLIGKFIDANTGKVNFKVKLSLPLVEPSPLVGGTQPKFDKYEIEKFNKDINNQIGVLKAQKGSTIAKAEEVEIAAIDLVIKWSKENKDRKFEWSSWYVMPSGDYIFVKCNTIAVGAKESSGILNGWYITEGTDEILYLADIQNNMFLGYRKYQIDAATKIKKALIPAQYYSEGNTFNAVVGNTPIQYVRFNTLCAVDIFQNIQNMPLKQRSLNGAPVNWNLADIKAIQTENFKQNLSVAINVVTATCASTEGPVATELYRIESGKIASSSEAAKEKAIIYCNLLAALDADLRQDFWMFTGANKIGLVNYHDKSGALEPVADFFFFKNKIPREESDYQKAIDFLIDYEDLIKNFKNQAALANSVKLTDLVVNKLSYMVGDILQQAACKYIITGPFKRLSATERKSLITDLLKNTTCTGSYYKNGAYPGCEDFILLTIENTPESQATELLREIKNFHIAKIIDKTGGLNAWQRSGIVSKLFELWAKSTDYDLPLYDKTTTYMANKRGFVFTEGSNKIDATVDGDKLSFQVVRIKRTSNGSNTNTYDTWENVGDAIKLSPMEEVLFICKSDLTLGKAKNGKQFVFEKGKEYRIPAMMLYIITKKDDDKKFIEGATLLVEATIFVVLSEVAITAIVADGWLAAAPQIIDFGVYLGDLAINAKIKTDPTWAAANKDLIAAYMETSFLWFGIRGLQQGAEAIEQNLRSKCGTSPAAGSVEEEILVCLNGKCFVAGTLIAIKDGNKKIEQIREKDVVWSWNIAKKERSLQKVVHVFQRTTTQLIHLFIGKDTIHTTPEHPFYVPQEEDIYASAENNKVLSVAKAGSWVLAKNLRKGAKIFLFSTLLATVDSTFAQDTTCTVYNFEVENTHNYFVGKEGVLVHNASYFDDFVKFIDNYKGSSLSAVQRIRLKEIFKGHDFLISEWKATTQLTETFWVNKMANIVDGPWYALHKEANTLFAAEVQSLKGLYPKAKIGYRGSLSRGEKFNKITKEFEEFNPNSFDMDGFIVSDELVAKFPVADQGWMKWRDARDLGSQPLFEVSADKLHLEFSNNLPGYRKNDIFTFKVWTEAEYEYEVLKNGYKLIK